MNPALVIAFIITVLGTVVFVVDAGNHLFGSYRRTTTGAMVRIVGLVVISLLLLTPLFLYIGDIQRELAEQLAFATGGAGVLIIVHFVIPYQFGIVRVHENQKDHSSFEMALNEGINLREVTFECGTYPADQEPFRVIVISDTHCNTPQTLDFLRSAVSVMGTMKNEVVLLLGDFGEAADLIKELIETVSSIKSRHGTFCVRGNHDCEGGREDVVANLLTDNNVTLLADESIKLPDCDVTLIGLERPWFKRDLPAKGESEFNIGLTHTPDNILLFEQLNIHFGFAGHTHGGKFRLPLFGSVLVGGRLGWFLDLGLFRHGTHFLYITSGIGYFPGVGKNRGEILRVVIQPTGQ